MPTISDTDIALAARAAGFDQGQLATAVAVALAESGGNTTVTNNNSNGTTDYGLFQINSIHDGILKSGDWRNANDNARMAKKVFDNRASWDNQGPWRAWSAYNNGAYLIYRGRAEAAVKGLPQSGIGNRPTESGVPGSTALPIADPTDILKQLTLLTEPGYWMRLGAGIAGFLLVAVALVAILVSNDSVTNAVKTGAKLLIFKKAKVK